MPLLLKAPPELVLISDWVSVELVTVSVASEGTVIENVPQSIVFPLVSRITLLVTVTELFNVALSQRRTVLPSEAALSASSKVA